MACGTRPCTNPHHMTIVTLTEARRGGDNTVLLPADVRDIQLAKKHRCHSIARQLAERTGCSTQTIYDIWAGRSWRRVNALSKRGAGWRGRPTQASPHSSTNGAKWCKRQRGWYPPRTNKT